MRHLPLLLLLGVLGSGAIAPGEDPVAEWLKSLTFHLPDVTQEQSGITLKASNFICHELEFNHLQSEVLDLGLSLTISGIGVKCSGSYAYHGFAIVSGQGDLSAQVFSGAGSHASVSFVGTDVDKGVPWKAETESCSCNLDFSIDFHTAVLGNLAKYFAKPLSKFINDQVMKKACAQLQDIASRNLSSKLQALNNWMLPPDAKHWVRNFQQGLPAQDSETFLPSRVFSARRLDSKQPSAFQTVDWTQTKALDWLGWVLSDLVGPRGLDRALRWAARNSSTIAVPGLRRFPVLNSTLDEPGAGLKLQIQVYLKNATVNGADSINNFSPLHAVGPNDLALNISFGTPTESALELGVDMIIKVAALDLATGELQSSVESEVSFHLGLLDPALRVMAEVLVDEDQWQKPRTLGQLLLGAKGCLSSLLYRPPILKVLDASFKGISSPLTFEAHSRSDLTRSIASLLNDGVSLFNKVYESLLPGAISRYLGSDSFLQTVNSAVKQAMEPDHCMTAAEADREIRDITPELYGNWPPIFDSWLRRMVDNIADGFIARNTTKIFKPFQMMPPIHLLPLAGVKLREVVLAGINHVPHLRVLVPDDSRPNSLGIEIVVDCPTPEQPWTPELLLNGSLSAGGFAGAGTLGLQLPCGSLNAKADVTVDIWDLLGMELPPSLPCALVSPLSQFDVTSFEYFIERPGQLSLKPDSGPAQYPFPELCELHPRACPLLSKFAKALADSGGINHLFQVARNLTLSRCVGAPASLGTAVDGDRKTDALGYSYVAADSFALWVWSCLITTVLAIVYTFCAEVGRRLAGEGCDPVHLSLSAACWSGSRGQDRIGAALITMCISFLLALCLVGRFLACYWLPYASATVGIVQKGTGTHVVPDTTILEFTYFGIYQAFWDGGSSYCHYLWLLTSLIAGLMSNALMLVAWLTPWLSSHRKILLRIALVLSRFPLSELETIGNSASTLNSQFDMPLGLVSGLHMEVQAGGHVSFLTSVCTIAAALILLNLGPSAAYSGRWPVRKTSQATVGAQVFACGALLLGVLLWALFPYLHVETLGIAGAVIDPVDRRGLDLADSDGLIFLLLTLGFTVAPAMQILAFVLSQVRATASRSDVWYLRILAEVGASFCLLDLFTIGYLATFLEGVNSFATAAAHILAEPLCKVSMKRIGEDCLGIQATVLVPGTVGMILAALGWSVFSTIQVVQPRFLLKLNSAAQDEGFIDCELERS